MVVAALVSRYWPSRRDVRKRRELRARSLLISVASDMDLITEWIFYFDTLPNPDVPHSIKSALLFFCFMGLITWLMVASDGKVVVPCLRLLNVPFFSTCDLLLWGILLEDIPQVVLSLIVESFYNTPEHNENSTSGLSKMAIVNVMTAAYDIMIKLSEAVDERNDVRHTGAYLTLYRGHEAPITSIARVDKRRIVTGSLDHTCKLWHLGPETNKKGVAPYSRSFRRVSIVGAPSRPLVDPENGGTGGVLRTCVKTFRHHIDAVNGVAVLGGDCFVSASADGTLKSWSLTGGSKSSSTDDNDDDDKENNNHNNENKKHNNSTRSNSSGKSESASSIDETPLHTFYGHIAQVTSVAAVDDDTFVSGSADKTIRLWNVHSTECLRIFTGHTKTITTVATLGIRQPFSPRPRWTRETLQPVVPAYPNKCIVSGSEDKTAKLWDVTTGECLQTFRGHMQPLTSIADVNSQSFVTSSLDHTLKLWNVQSSTCQKTFRGHANQVTDVDSIDEETIVSSSNDGTAKIWCAMTGTCLRTFEEAHEGSVMSVASVDGRTFVTGSSDYSAKLWAIRSPENFYSHVEEPLRDMCGCVADGDDFIIGGSVAGAGAGGATGEYVDYKRHLQMQNLP